MMMAEGSGDKELVDSFIAQFEKGGNTLQKKEEKERKTRKHPTSR